jgi:hypothetical protein
MAQTASRSAKQLLHAPQYRARREHRGTGDVDESLIERVDRCHAIRLAHSNHENGGARSFSSLKILMCLHRVLQRIPLIDLNADAACRHMAK